MSDICMACGGEYDEVECGACHGTGEQDLYELFPLEFDRGANGECHNCNGWGVVEICLECEEREDEYQQYD